MATHKSALVPIEAWAYSSPHLKDQGIQIDIGLMAEALLYYDSVYINVANQPQLADLLDWFRRQNRLNKFIELVEDGIINFYEYSFMTAAILNGDSYSIWNMDDREQEKPNSFEQRYLRHREIRKVLPAGPNWKRIITAIREHAIEVKAIQFGSAVENAKADFDNPTRNALLIQAYLDELYRIRRLGPTPKVLSNIEYIPNTNQKRIHYNVDLDNLSKLSGKNLNFHKGTPLTANAISNRLLLSASSLGCDLYLASPISSLVGDKLYESARKVLKRANIISELEARVEFPDVRGLVNSARLNIDDILELREKAVLFRKWLQTETERDRDAIIAYHNEIGQKSSSSSVRHQAIQLFGILASGATGALLEVSLERSIGGAVGAGIGAGVGAGVGYLIELATKLEEGWKPVVFGNWMMDRIKKHLDEFEIDAEFHDSIVE